MTSTSAQDIAGSSRNTPIDDTSLPQPTSHQLSKRQQYDVMLNAEAGSSTGTASLGSPAAHPSYPAVAPLCRRYPTQASAIFQTYLDLKNGAAAWDTVEPLALTTSTSIDDALAPVEQVQKDLSQLSDAEAEALVNERLEGLKKGVAKLGLVHRGDDSSEDGESEDLLKVGIAAIKGRRKDAKAYEIVIPLTVSQHLRASQFKALFTLIEAHAACCPTGEHVNTSHVLLAIIAPDSTLVYYLVSKGMVKPIN